MGIGIVRPLWRGLRVVEHLLTGALISLYMGLATRLGRRPAWAPGVVSWWHGRLCRAMGVEVQVSGRLAERCLLVANHVSWLDIPVLGAQARVGFLSKAEVRRWPLVGWMAAVAGTLFIERGANRTAEVTAQIADGLARGRTLAIFPEGTTSDGRTVRRFHPRLFAIAQQPGLAIQPVTLAYRRGDGTEPDQSVPFVGDDTLLANLLRIVRHPHLVARVSFLPPIVPAAGQDRRALAQRTRLAIVQALGLPPEHPGEAPQGAAPRQPASGPDASPVPGPLVPAGSVPLEPEDAWSPACSGQA